MEEVTAWGCGWLPGWPLLDSPGPQGLRGEIGFQQLGRRSWGWDLAAGWERGPGGGCDVRAVAGLSSLRP